MWKIDKINTGTGQVTMKDESGKTLDLVIPHEHRCDPEKSRAHIAFHCRAHEKPGAPVTFIETKSPSLLFLAFACCAIGFALTSFVMWVLSGH